MLVKLSRTIAPVKQLILDNTAIKTEDKPILKKYKYHFLGYTFFILIIGYITGKLCQKHWK